MLENVQIECCKVVLVGEAGVGKTCIISQYVNSIFQEEMESTMNGSFFSKSFTFNKGKILRLEIWDTAGQEKYRSLSKMFYKDANAVILVYDITRLDSFQEIKKFWMKEIEENTPKEINKILVANKSDLYNEEAVDEEKARNYAEEIGASYFQTSAKNNYGINDLFMEIAKKHTGFDDVKEVKDDNDEKYSRVQTKTRDSVIISKENIIVDKEKKKKKCCKDK